MADQIPKLPSKIDATSTRFEKNMRAMAELVAAVRNEEGQIRQGGGEKAIESQHAKKRLTARERINLLIDRDTEFFELGLFAAYEMYEEWGGAPSAGVVTGLGRVHGRLFMLIVNDATVKAGAFFPMTAKKVIRAQNIAIENHIPTIYPLILTTLAGSSAITRSCPPWAFRRLRRLWACAWPVAHICRSCATPY
jgi:acetyl-CoA carboxylase carboxyltransferase component